MKARPIIYSILAVILIAAGIYKITSNKKKNEADTAIVAQKNTDIIVHLSGGALTIKWANDGHVWMTGPAETIARGEFYWRRSSSNK